MTYVSAEICIDVKDRVCTKDCCVECTYGGPGTCCILPDEGTDSALCASVCPVDAIRDEDGLSPQSAGFTAVKVGFFNDEVTGWSQRSGLNPVFHSGPDHPVVASWQSNGG